MAPVGSNSTGPTKPISFEGHHGRRRSDSVSESSEDSASPTTPYTASTPFPASATGVPPRISPSSPTSPIFSYFFGQSSPTTAATKSPASTFPLRRNFGPPVVEDDESSEAQPAGAHTHGRRASTAWTGTDRFVQPPPPPPVTSHNDQQDRAAGVLRRLSLGGALGRPQISAFKPAPAQGHRSGTPPPALTARKPRRSNTMAAGTPRPPRAPSPMGERILKGHFDGFN